MPPTITEARYHQSLSDQSLQVYFSGTGYDPTKPCAFSFMGGGIAEFEIVDRATGKVVRSQMGRFSPLELTQNLRVIDDTPWGVRVGKPFTLPGIVVAPGQYPRLKRVSYDTVFVGDLTNGDGVLVPANEDIPQPPF